MRHFFALFFSLIIPLIVFLRVSSEASVRFGLNGWESLIFGGVASIISAALTGYIFTRKIKKGKSFLKAMRFIGFVVLAAYLSLGMIYINRLHLKSTQLNRYYKELHPVLRVSVVAATIFDRHLVVTDIGRNPDDYISMGLKKRKHSWHFKQKTGFIHAVDLRTINRNELLNQLTELYFKISGFNTLRHTGTNDHLHVELPITKETYSIKKLLN